MTASQALLTAQTLLVHTTVLVTLDTWGMERIAASLKVRLFTIPLHHLKWTLLMASNTLQLLEDSCFIFPIKHKAKASIFFEGGGGGDNIKGSSPVFVQSESLTQLSFLVKIYSNSLNGLKNSVIKEMHGFPWQNITVKPPVNGHQSCQKSVRLKEVSPYRRLKNIVCV